MKYAISKRYLEKEAISETFTVLFSKVHSLEKLILSEEQVQCYRDGFE